VTHHDARDARTVYTVRPLQPADAEALGSAHIAIWREAYAGLMPADYLAGLSVERSVLRWRTVAAEPAPGTATVVGLADGEVVGFSTAGPSRDEPADPACELWVVNVLAAHHGTGLALRLVEAAFEGAGIGPHDAVSLWVARGNDRACAFYRRLGFAPDGRTKAHEPTGAVEERWVRPASPAHG
jgi:ribosomal protein S18 acetylase RimI-like enzyme